ncbi:MAG: DUF4136 domain-containing protein [Planctomycetota bacterium]
MPTARVSLALALAAIAAPACQSVDHNYDDIVTRTIAGPRAVLGDSNTYAWAGALADVRDPDGRWTEPGFDIGTEITALVNRELGERGFVEVDVNPDLLVYYGIGIDMENVEMVQTNDDNPSHFQSIPKGAMAVTIAEASTQRIIWIGAAQGDIGQNRPMDVVRGRLDYAVDEMFERFPN